MLQSNIQYELYFCYIIMYFWIGKVVSKKRVVGRLVKMAEIMDDHNN